MPAPLIVRSFALQAQTSPLYSPAAITTVSPSFAAFAACEGLSYLPPRPTVSVAAETDITAAAAAAANVIAAGMFTTLPPAQRTIS